MDWKIIRDHPFVVTLFASLALGFLVRSITAEEPRRYQPPAVADRPVHAAVVTPAPVLASPAPVTPSPAAASAPASRPSFPSAQVAIVDSPRPTYSGRGRGYNTYSFTLDSTTYPLDGQASFDHLCEMKRQANMHDADITRLRAVCQALSAEIDGNQSQLSFMRSSLDRSDEFAINRFNAEVRRSNQVVEQYRARQAELNGYVDQHNAVVQAMHVYASQHRR